MQEERGLRVGVRQGWIGVPRMGKNSLDMKQEAMWTQESDLIQGGVR